MHEFISIVIMIFFEKNSAQNLATSPWNIRGKSIICIKEEKGNEDHTSVLYFHPKEKRNGITIQMTYEVQSKEEVF